jgi:M6 family metalloprotease-like protein
MRSRIVLLVSLFTLLAFVAPPSALASIKSGSACSPFNYSTTVAGFKYTCSKVGKKLVWSKGIKVSAPKTGLTATPSPSPSPSPTPTQTALKPITASAVLPCKLPIQDGRGDVSIGGWPRIADRMRTTGTITTQVIFVDFSDAPAVMTPQDAFTKISGAKDTFSEMSYGLMNYNLVPTYKWYRMKLPSTSYAPLNKSFLSHRAYIAEALGMADPDVDFSNSDAFVIIANPDSKGIGDSGPGFASTYGNGFTLDGKYIANGATSSHDLNGWKSIWLNHEVTHTMGLVDLYAATSGGGSDDWDLHRYVGQFSYMGFSSFESNAPGLTAYERWYLNWLDDSQIICSTENKIVQQISKIETPGGVKAVMIPLSATREIVIESRRAGGIDRGLKKSGALVYVVDSTKQSGMGPVQIYPVDLKNDPKYLLAPRGLGESVSVEGYTITVTAADASGDTISVLRN